MSEAHKHYTRDQLEFHTAVVKLSVALELVGHSRYEVPTGRPPWVNDRLVKVYNDLVKLRNDIREHAGFPT